MGQVSSPSAKGFTVNVTDRQTGPGAGSGQSGNRVVMLGANAGFNSTPSDLIVIGNNALAAGATDNANYQGAVVIGSQSLALATSNAAVSGATFGMTAVGYNILPAATRPFSSTMIGGNVFAAFAADNAGRAFGNNVVIGEQAGYAVTAGAGQSILRSVIIGVQALGNATAAGVADDVIIGYAACLNRTGGSAGSSNVIIGSQAAQSLSGAGANGNYNVVIGSGAGSSLSSGLGNILIGFNATQNGTDNYQIVIGYGAKINASGGQRSIVIGYQAGSQTTAAAQTDAFIVESYDGSTVRSLFFGNLNSGNLIIGNLSTNRDLATIASTNAVKIQNGTRGAGNPVGGGFFYVSAGALHWVGSSGTDTTVAVA